MSIIEGGRTNFYFHRSTLMEQTDGPYKGAVKNVIRFKAFCTPLKGEVKIKALTLHLLTLVKKLQVS